MTGSLWDRNYNRGGLTIRPAHRAIADLGEQTAPIQTGGAEPLRDGEHHLPVRHRREQCRVEPLHPDYCQPLGVATRTEAAAREREQAFVCTVLPKTRGDSLAPRSPIEPSVTYEFPLAPAALTGCWARRPQPVADLARWTATPERPRLQ